MVLYPPPTRPWKHCPDCGIRLTRELIDTPAPGHEPWSIVCSWKRVVGWLLVADASSRISSCQEQVKMQEQLKQMQQTLQQQQQQMQQLQEMQEQMREMQEQMQQGWQSVASLQDQIKQLEEQQWRLQYKIDEVQCHHRNTRLELLGKQRYQGEAIAAAEERLGIMFQQAWTAAFESAAAADVRIMHLATQVAAAAHNQTADRAAILQLQKRVLNCQQLLEAAAAAAAAEEQDQRQQQRKQQQQIPGAAVEPAPRPLRTSKTSTQPGGDGSGEGSYNGTTDLDEWERQMRSRSGGHASVRTKVTELVSKQVIK